MKNLKNSIIFKVIVIFILILVLMIPTSMVQSLVHERENVQESAIDEVSSKWGMGQTLTGPYLSIPYDRYVKRYSQKDSVEKVIKEKEWIYLLPELLSIDGDISPEKRYRGIYEVVVYDGDFNLSGHFKPLNLKGFDINPKLIHFDQARLNLGITDLKGIEQQVHVNWNDEVLDFNSGLSTSDLCNSGINTVVELAQNDSSDYQFNLDISLKGSQHIYFIPLGKTSQVELSSEWPTPSFGGEYLPDNREVGESGFTANWEVLHLNRNYPQSWTMERQFVENSSFGTDLLLPVDNYKKSYRVARYAILFLVFTFMVFFFVEVLNKTYIHPIQYLLVGIALVVFYSLLLAISEHIKFNFAYLLSMLLTLLLIGTYTKAIIKVKRVPQLITGILLSLYGFIFTIIQLEDYALLIGSIGVFVILGLVMYFSRKIDWYGLQIGDAEN